MTRGYDWAAIKNGINIVEIVGASVALKRKGNLHEACCPFHQETTPSFKVYSDHYHCFGCGAHGDAVDFIAQTTGCSTGEAIARLGAGDFKMTTETHKIVTERAEVQRREREAATFAARLRWEKAEPASDANAYLVRKRISPHLARQEGPNLLLPVFDRDGNIQSVQTILADGTKLFHEAAPMKGGRCYFGIAIGRSIVCEGYATAASIFESVPERVVCAYSMSGVEDMVRELVAAGMDVAIASDHKGLAKMLRLGAELGVPVFATPDSSMDDFNDMACAMGHEAVKECLRGKPIAALPPVEEKPETPAPANDDSDPVDVWARNKPPAMPVGVLPPLIEKFAAVRAKMIGCDPGGLAMSALAVCAAAIPDHVKLKVKAHESWTESARLWVMLIGDPSSKKSPIMRAAANKLAKMDSEMLRQFAKDLIQWQNDKKDGVERDKPMETRLRIEDITMEAAQEVCRSSPHGVLALQDELSGWFGGIEKYSGGKGGAKDRSFWLRAYNGGEYAVNRINRASFLIDNLSISILGGIQPDAVRKVTMDSVEDGLIQRFLPVILPSAQIGVDEELPDIASEYEGLVAALRNVRTKPGMFEPMPLVFDPEARAVRERLEREHHAMMIALEHVSKKFAAHIGKFDGIFPRLCIIWHCIENVNAATLPDIITGDTAQRAADFLHGYILGQSKAFYHGILGISEDQQEIEDVAGYILAHQVEVVTMRTFSRGSTMMRKATRQNVEPICQQLEALGWIESIDSRGEKFSAKVNPRVHEVYREKAETERLRRAETVETIRKLVAGE